MLRRVMRKGYANSELIQVKAAFMSYPISLTVVMSHVDPQKWHFL